MFTIIKFIYLIFKSGKNVINPNLNPLRYAPQHIRYFTSVLLGCFWCLAFGIYFGELITIGYNMIGHVAIISMAFGTWAVFKSFEKTYEIRKEQDWLRMPDRSSRCDEMTDEERLAKVKEWNNRDIWNDPAYSKEEAEDRKYFYGS